MLLPKTTLSLYVPCIDKFETLQLTFVPSLSMLLIDLFTLLTIFKFDIFILAS